MCASGIHKLRHAFLLLLGCDVKESSSRRVWCKEFRVVYYLINIFNINIRLLALLCLRACSTCLSFFHDVASFKRQKRKALQLFYESSISWHFKTKNAFAILC